MKIALLKSLRNFEQWENDISDEVIKISIGTYTKLSFGRAMCPFVRDHLFSSLTRSRVAARTPCQSQLRNSSLHEDFFLF
jgi:hypothetical protein